jgi:hypothetical protein
MFGRMEGLRMLKFAGLFLASAVFSTTFQFLLHIFYRETFYDMNDPNPGTILVMGVLMVLARRFLVSYAHE